MKALLLSVIMLTAFSSAVKAEGKKLVSYECGHIKEDKTMTVPIYVITINGRDSSVKRIHGIIEIGPHVGTANEFRYSAHAGELHSVDRDGERSDRTPAFILEHYQIPNNVYAFSVVKETKGPFKGKYKGYREFRDIKGEVGRQEIYCQDKK